MFAEDQIFSHKDRARVFSENNWTLHESTRHTAKAQSKDPLFFVTK